jgi:protein SCO1/2
MKNTTPDLARRHVCVSAAAVCAAALGSGVGHAGVALVAADHGRVDPPVAVPDIAVHRAGGGVVARLAALLRGRATALHLMFTGCSSVCPIQGAIFQQVQALLPDQQARRIQLMSLSIDPLDDTPRAMRAWLARFGARDGWVAVAPEPKDLDLVLDLFGQGRNAVESHATQVNIIDRHGELVFRTPQLPSADAIANILRRV